MAMFGHIINEEKRSDLPDSSFGIPEDRKYPLDTEEHVRSAIKLFGHAEESKKKSLARRIQNAAKKYNIDIPENTQCYKYLQESISESTHKNIEYKTVSSSSSEFKKYLNKYNIVKDPDSVSKEYNGDILIDVKEDKLIGHVFIGNTKDKGFITDLVVNKKYRKLGFGNILLDSAMHKYHGVDLTVRKDNSIAIDMYKKHGFVIDDSLDAGKDMYYMSLKSNIKESKDKSSYSSSYKKKSGVSFKYIDAYSPEGKKYLKDDPKWDKESIDWINTAKSGGELVVDTKNKAIAGFIFVNKSGIIAPLFINHDYRGYGLSNKLVEDAINKYGGRELGVYSDNEIALNIYKKNGFKQYRTKKYKNGDEVLFMKLESFVENMRDATPEEQKNVMNSIKSISTETGVSFYDEDYIEEVSREDISSKFLEKNDTCVNLENWQPNGYNILYITGLSGSGKTTLAEDLAKEFKCYRIEQDYIGVYFFRKKIEAGTRDKVLNKLAKEAPPDAIRWLKDNKDKYCVDSWKEATPIIKEFTEWFEATHEGDGNLYIINGAWIFEYNPTHFYDRPIIIKESNTFKSLIRRTGRESGHEDSLEKNIKSFIKNISFISKKSYRDAGKRARAFAKNIASNGIDESSSYNYFITNDNGNEHFNVAKYFQMIMFQELDAYMVGNHIHPRDIESDDGCYTIATYTVDNEFNRDHVFNFLNHVSNMINNSVTSKYEIRDMSSGILGVAIKPGHENEVIDDIDNKVCSNFGWTNNDITLENIDEAATGTIIPKRFKIFYGDKILNKKVIEPKITKFNRKEVQATISMREAGIECLNTDSDNIDMKVVDGIVRIYIDRKDFDLANECVIYELKNDGKWFYKEGDPTGAYRRDTNAVVINEYEFNSVTEMMSMLGGYELYDYKTKLPINRFLEDADITLEPDTMTPYGEVRELGFTLEQDKKAKNSQKRNPELVIFNLSDAYLSRKNLDEKLNKFKGLSEKQRKLCNRISLSIFNYNMYDMYNKLSVIVDKHERTKDKDLSSDSRVTDIEIISTSDNETLRNFKDEIKQEATSIGRDKAKIAYKLLDLYNSREDMTFTESVNTKRFIEETIKDLNNPLLDIDLNTCAYFTPQKMLSMGVFNDNPEDNFYNCKSTRESLDWFNTYCISNEIINEEEWFSKLKDVYTEMLQNPIPENKQRVLEMGWNPELYPSMETIKKASDITKYTIAESMNIINIDARELSDVSITEASTKNNDLEPIFIITSFTETPFGKVIKKVTNGRYTHASLSFDTSLENLYTFNFVNKIKRNGGISFESLSGYIKECPDALIKVQVIFVKPSDMKIIKMKIDEYVANYRNTSYNVANCFDVAINRARKSKDFSMICSEFVASVLKAANIDITNGKSLNIVTPKDLSTVVNNKVYLIYEGFADRYNAKGADKLVNKIKSKAKYIKEYTKLYNDKITNVLESFINIEERAKVEISDEGDISIKDFKKINFESEYYHSSKLLKTYVQNGNYDGMKYELAKLWYLNTLLENKLYSSKLKTNTKELNNYRSKILNLFNRNLKIVTKAEPDFDFTSYYQSTQFYDNNITIKKSTINGVLDIIKRII